jgi:hypothetical protein
VLVLVRGNSVFSRSFEYSECINFSVRCHVRAGDCARSKKSIIFGTQRTKHDSVGARSDLLEIEVHIVISRTTGPMQDPARDSSKFTAIAFLPQAKQLILGRRVPFETSSGHVIMRLILKCAANREDLAQLSLGGN